MGSRQQCACVRSSLTSLRKSEGADDRGHYNQADLPEEKARIKVEMEHREEKRYKEHKEEVDNYRKNKKKWAKRLSHVKFIAAIVALGLCRSLPVCVTSQSLC